MNLALCHGEGNFFTETNASPENEVNSHPQSSAFSYVYCLLASLDYFDIALTTLVTVLTCSECLNPLTFMWDAFVASIVTYHAMLLTSILHKLVHLQSMSCQIQLLLLLCILYDFFFLMNIEHF